MTLLSGVSGYRLMRANTVCPYGVVLIGSLQCTKPSPAGEGGRRSLTDEVFEIVLLQPTHKDMDKVSGTVIQFPLPVLSFLK